METAKHENKPTNFNWVKNLYFYLVLAGTILTIAISIFVLTYSSAIRFVFTDLQNKPYISYETCKNGANYYPTSPVESSDNKKIEEQKLSSDEQKACADKQLNIEYQQTLLSTSLAILVAGIILTIHLVIFKKKK